MRTIPLTSLILALAVSAHAGPSWDVAPPVAGGATPPLVCPGGNDFVDPGDALITLRRALALIPGFSCSGQPISDSIVDVAPPLSVDQSVFPPIVVTGGDGAISPGDALLILRAAVGLIDLRAPPPPPVNLALRALLDTVPQTPSLGEVDRPPLGDFPQGVCESGGDCDCNLDGILDLQEPAFMRVVVISDQLPTEPYRVCALMRQETADMDFDAPPIGNFPGPEDHDGGGDGALNNPPPTSYDACVTVCPEDFSEPGIECTEIDPVSDEITEGFIARVGPIFPDTLTPDRNQRWSAVVDPDFATPDESFDDNVTADPLIVRVEQCPDISPDLIPTPALGAGSPITVIPNEPSQYDDIAFQVGIRNQGDLRAIQTFDVDFYVDGSPLPPPFIFPIPGAGECPGGNPDQCLPFPAGDCFRTIAASPTSPLLVGEEVMVTCSDFDPSPESFQPLNLAPGLHFVMVLADSFGQFQLGSVLEQDEVNNVYPRGFGATNGRFCVAASGFGSPDLAFAKVRFLVPESADIACDRKEGDRVEIELTIANLDEDPAARDLGISRPFVPRSYDIVTSASFPLPDPLPDPPPLPGCSALSPVHCTDLDGLSFDCVPLGSERAPIRGQYLFELQDTDLRLELVRSDVGVPPDVNSSNNVVIVPLLNKPPAVEAGPAKSGVAGEGVKLEATASDPNDVPAGSQPLILSWSVKSQPEGSSASFDDAHIEDPLFTGSDAGDYTLKLSAKDCQDATKVTDTVVVNLIDP